MEINYDTVDKARKHFYAAFKKALIEEIKKHPDREFTEQDAKVMSREYYDSTVKLIAKKESDKQSKIKYNSLIGKIKRRR